MSINLIALLMLLVMQVMITVFLNSLWKVMKKAGYLLKALVLQVPAVRRTYLQMEELEETAEQRKADRRKVPEQRKPTVEMETEQILQNPAAEMETGQILQNLTERTGQKLKQNPSLHLTAPGRTAPR